MTPTFMERYLGMFRFQGWFFHDVTLGIVYGITFLFGMVLFMMLFKRKKPKKIAYSYQKQEKETVFTFPSLISFCLSVFFFFLLVSHFGLFVFGGGMSRNELTLDSEGIISDEGLVIAKWRRSVNDGTSNGITTSTAHFQLNALDVKTGTLRWNRRSDWHEKLIGETSEGLLLLQAKKGELKVIESQTGKDRWGFREIEERFPLMKGKWSKTERDYLVTGDSYLYVYGLDGRYYQLDLSNNQLVSESSFAELFLERDNLFSEAKAMGIDELAEKNGEDFFNGKVLPIEDQVSYFIVHSKTRESDSEGIISALDHDQSTLKWQSSLGTRLSETPFNNSSLAISKSRFYFTTNGFSFIFNKGNGNIELVFDQLSHRQVQQGS